MADHGARRSALGEEVFLVTVQAPAAAHQMAAVHEQSASAAYAHIFSDPFPREEALARWMRHRGPVIMAVVDGATVGFAAAEGQVLEALYVIPTHAGCGVGSALLDAIGPVHRLWVLEQNLNARRFYERRQWRWSGGTRAAVDAGGVTELLYAVG